MANSSRAPFALAIWATTQSMNWLAVSTQSPMSSLNSDNLPMDFKDKLVVITGVGRAGQAGEVIAKSFAERGASLALLDLQETEVRARAATLTELGFTATAHVANLADPELARAAANEVL